MLQILIEAAQHVSETLRTVASELSDPLSTDPDEKLGGASALAEAVVWIADPQDPLRDGSEALAPGDLYGAIAAIPVDPFGFTRPPRGIAVLVRALVMLAVHPPDDRPDLRARARALLVQAAEAQSRCGAKPSWWRWKERTARSALAPWHLSTRTCRCRARGVTRDRSGSGRIQVLKRCLTTLPISIRAAARWNNGPNPSTVTQIG